MAQQIAENDELQAPGNVCPHPPHRQPPPKPQCSSSNPLPAGRRTNGRLHHQVSGMRQRHVGARVDRVGLRANQGVLTPRSPAASCPTAAQTSRRRRAHFPSTSPRSGRAFIKPASPAKCASPPPGPHGLRASDPPPRPPPRHHRRWINSTRHEIPANATTVYLGAGASGASLAPLGARE